MRIGHGFDVHALVSDRPLVIGGVSIPFEKGLAGHSDADVLLHAICDACLGAAGLGDIGRHFPDSDDQYKNIDSRKLLRSVKELLRKNQLKVISLDSTVVAENPKLSAYIETMRLNIAEDLSILVEVVNVKATTTEGLGFEGQEQGITAHAVVLLREGS